MSWIVVAHGTRDKKSTAPATPMFGGGAPRKGRHAGQVLDGVRLNPVQQPHLNAVLKKASIESSVSIDGDNGMVVCKGPTALGDIRKLIKSTDTIEKVSFGARVVSMTFDSYPKAAEFIPTLKSGVHIQRNGPEGKRKAVLTILKGKKKVYRIFLTYKDGETVPLEGKVKLTAAKATKSELKWQKDQKAKATAKSADDFGLDSDVSGFRSDGCYVAVKSSGEKSKKKNKQKKKVDKKKAAPVAAKIVGTHLTVFSFVAPPLSKQLKGEEATAVKPVLSSVDTDSEKKVAPAVANAWKTTSADEGNTTVAKPNGKKKSAAYLRRLAKRAAGRFEAEFPSLESNTSTAVMRGTSNGAA